MTETPAYPPEEYFSAPNTTPPSGWPVPEGDDEPTGRSIAAVCRMIADPVVEVTGSDVVARATGAGAVMRTSRRPPRYLSPPEHGIERRGRAGMYAVFMASPGSRVTVKGAAPVRIWVDGRPAKSCEAPAGKAAWVVILLRPVPERYGLHVESGELLTLPFTGSEKSLHVLMLGPTPSGGIPAFEDVIPGIHDVNDPDIFARGWPGYRGRPIGFTTDRRGVVLGLVPRSTVYGLPGNRNHAWRTYGAWLYPTGVFLTGAQRCAGAFGLDSYDGFVRSHLRFVARHFPQARWEYSLPDRGDLLFQLVRLSSLDDCGAMGSALAEAYLSSPEPSWFPVLERITDYIMNRLGRAPDGTFCRRRGSRGGRGRGPVRIWADDVYHGGAFLVRMGAITGKGAYYDEAARQMLRFADKLYMPDTRLFRHACYYTEGELTPAHWGRADGWALVAETEILSYLPEDHPDRDRLLDLFRAHVAGRLAAQDPSGFWHQVLDRPDSYCETSATAMAVYALSRGVSRGWLGGELAFRARRAAVAGWRAITTWHIHGDGVIEGTCKGTDIRRNMGYYYRRPVITNDLHGVGPILMAGAELAGMVR